MRTDELIADLARRASPVRPLPPPLVRATAWLGIAIVSAASGIAILGPPTDLLARAVEADFIWRAALAGATSVVAVVAAFVMSVPGAERSAVVRAGAVVVGGAWLLALVTEIFRAGAGFADASDWYICFLRVVVVAAPPAAVLLTMLRRAAPLRLEWTGGLAAAAAMAIAAVAIQIACPIDDPAHALLGHAGPAVALGTLGAALGARLLGPRRLR